MRNRKLLREPPNKCHLCLLPIPTTIVSNQHPLFGTIDHDQPLSRGGKNNKKNRAPAHNICNKIKKNAWPVPALKRISMVELVSGELRKIGQPVSRKRVKLLKGIILGDANYKFDAMDSLARWDDDGGAAYVRPHWRPAKDSRDKLAAC